MMNSPVKLVTTPDAAVAADHAKYPIASTQPTGNRSVEPSGNSKELDQGVRPENEDNSAPSWDVRHRQLFFEQRSRDREIAAIHVVDEQ